MLDPSPLSDTSRWREAVVSKARRSKSRHPSARVQEPVVREDRRQGGEGRGQRCSHTAAEDTQHGGGRGSLEEGAGVSITMYIVLLYAESEGGVSRSVAEMN
jgi:hypothetical protein